MGGDSGSVATLVFALAISLIIIPMIFYFPFRRIFWRAGINKNLAFVAFVPVVGFLILLGMAAFMDWPNEPGGYR